MPFVDTFMLQETQKFKVELLHKLSEDVDDFGDDLHAVIDVCAQVNLFFFFKEQIFMTIAFCGCQAFDKMLEPNLCFIENLQTNKMWLNYVGHYFMQLSCFLFFLL